MRGSTNATAEKWTKGTTVSATLMGYGLDIGNISHIYIPMNVAPDVSRVHFTGDVWGRKDAGDIYLATNVSIVFAESAMGVFATQSQIGATVTNTSVTYQLSGTWTLA